MKSFENYSGIRYERVSERMIRLKKAMNQSVQQRSSSLALQKPDKFKYTPLAQNFNTCCFDTIQQNLDKKSQGIRRYNERQIKKQISFMNEKENKLGHKIYHLNQQANHTIKKSIRKNIRNTEYLQISSGMYQSKSKQPIIARELIPGRLYTPEEIYRLKQNDHK